MNTKEPVWWHELIFDCLQAICIGIMLLFVIALFSLVSFITWITGDSKQ